MLVVDTVKEEFGCLECFFTFSHTPGKAERTFFLALSNQKKGVGKLDLYRSWDQRLSPWDWDGRLTKPHFSLQRTRPNKKFPG
jgi:hypothetical protein